MKRKYERPTYNEKYNHWFHEEEFNGSSITLGDGAVAYHKSKSCSYLSNSKDVKSVSTAEAKKMFSVATTLARV